jgi:FRG domain
VVRLRRTGLSVRLSFGKSARPKGAQSAKVQDRNALMKLIVEASPIFTQISSFSHEPLLQHYGLATTWIDLVDNIWVALWFACHKAHASGKRSQYLHFETRLPGQTPDDFAYILLIAVDSEPGGAPGLLKGKSTELVDLRVTCPSIFLRPHAQPGPVQEAWQRNYSSD